MAKRSKRGSGRPYDDDDYNDNDDMTDEIEDEDDESCDEYEDDEEEEEEELPEEVEIAKAGLGYDASESNIKKYLRDNYGYYLAKGNELDIDEEGDGNVYVGNIRWGRKI